METNGNVVSTPVVPPPVPALAVPVGTFPSVVTRKNLVQLEGKQESSISVSLCPYKD
jgi:hypothetical protein